MFTSAGRWLVPVAFVSVAVPTALAITPPSYVVTDLSAIGIDRPTAINNRDVVLGDGFVTSPSQVPSVLYDTRAGAATRLPDFGHGLTEGLGLNNLNQVVGVALTGGESESFLYSLEGTVTLLPPSVHRATRIGDSGTIIGTQFVPGPSFAFVYSGGRVTDLGTLGGDFTFGQAINGRDVIVGTSQLAPTNGSPSHAFVSDCGTITDLGTLDPTNVAAGSTAYDINIDDDIVGSSDAADGHKHLFLYSGGAMRDLGTLAGGDTYGFAISTYDQIVGQAATGPNPGDPTHAFLFSDGAMHDLNDLIPADSGWTLQTATDVNDNGYIVGQGVFNGQARAFLLRPAASFDPVPLPPAFWPGLLLLSALTVVTARRPRDPAAAFVR